MVLRHAGATRLQYAERELMLRPQICHISIWLQLLAWQRKCAQAGRGRALYRIAPQCSAAPRHLVAKPIKDASAAALDPRGAFIIQQDACLLVWKVDVYWLPKPVLEA